MEIIETSQKELTLPYRLWNLTDYFNENISINQICFALEVKIDFIFEQLI